MPTSHAHNFSPTILGPLPTTHAHTYDFSLAFPYQHNQPIHRAILVTLFDPYCFTMVLWKSQWDLMGSFQVTFCFCRIMHVCKPHAILTVFHAGFLLAYSSALKMVVMCCSPQHYRYIPEDITVPFISYSLALKMEVTWNPQHYIPEDRSVPCTSYFIF